MQSHRAWRQRLPSGLSIFERQSDPLRCPLLPLTVGSTPAEGPCPFLAATFSQGLFKHGWVGSVVLRSRGPKHHPISHGSEMQRFG
jgi:hypothetical protein